MDKILHEVLAEDKSLLGRRDELTAALERKVPGNLKRDFTPIKKAISLNVGEKFLTGNSDKEATKEEVREILKASGMQAARIEFVIETFTKALDWDKPLIPVNIIKNFDVPEENVQQSKVNIIKIPYIEPKEISEPITNDESVKIEEPKPEPPVEKTEIVPHENPNHIVEPPRQNYQQQPRWQENSTPLPPNHKDKIFTTEGRLNRLAYFLKGLKLFFITIIGGMLVEFLIGIPILIATCVGSWMIGIRRMHDLNKSGWWMLILFIPYINIVFSIYMLLAPGTVGANRYGADPLME